MSLENAVAESDRVRTGIPGLDRMLGGGFLRGNSILLQGTPGSGRTSLGMAIIVNGIRQFNEPGIILSFEQFPDYFYRDASHYGWDLRSMEADGRLRVIFARRDDLYSSFAEKEGGAITKLTDGTIDLGARRVLVDSVSQFWRLPVPAEDQKKHYFEFVMKLKGLDLTPLLVSDLGPSETGHPEEERTVDTIVRLMHSGSSHMGERRMRSIEVVKSRGQEALEGKHPFRITTSGICVSPYLQDRVDSEEAVVDCRDKSSTGVADLDGLLHGGIQKGSISMIAGMGGSGKTTLAAHFVAAGLSAGEPGVFVTLGESRRGLLCNMERRGLGFSEAVSHGELAVFSFNPSDKHPIEFYYELEEMLDQMGGRRVVIDGLAQLLAPAHDTLEAASILAMYTNLFRRRRVTALFTCQADVATGLSGLASIPHAAMMDNVLYLGIVELESKLRKVMVILKTRGEYTDQDLRELVLTPRGINIAHLFSGVSGILKGSASGHPSEVTRSIMDPLFRIRDFVNSAQVETPEQARMAIESIRREFNVLAQNLSEHFSYEDESEEETPKP